MGEMKMQADPAYTGLVEPFDLRRRRVGLEQGNAAIAAASGAEKIEQHRMIAVVAGRVHENAALKAEKIVEPEQILLGRVRGRERPIRRIGKFAVRAEHMEMRVARERRQFQFRLLRIRIRRRDGWREIVGSNGHRRSKLRSDDA